MDDDSLYLASHVGCDARFMRVGVHSAAADAALVRNEFAAWLRNHFVLDDERMNDVLLAVYEALANAAEHAYPNPPQAGTLDLHAIHAADSGTLDVTVADHGHWRPTVVPPPQLRGRGIPLMRALADSTAIDATGSGTEVTLGWLRVEKR